MLNNEVYLKTSAEVCTQVGSYFDIVDNCISLADTNKQYTINPQTSYAPSPPIRQGSYTSVIISPNSHNTADIYNGFIRADMEVTVKMIGSTISGLIKDNIHFDRVWFGFKDARDAIEKYEILSNGNTIYTQNFACEESFLTACCANEVTKRADVYSKTRHKDIWKYTSGNRTGFVVEWNNINSDKKKIHLKIDLRRFLPLSNIKYLPAFAGKIELRLYFSCAGMVCCPIGPDQDLVHNPKVFAGYTLGDITTEFTPIGEPITMWTKFTESTLTLESTERTFNVVEYSVTECSSIIPCFGIDNDVYNILVQRYSDPTHPLTFPTQTLSVYTTTNALKAANDKTTITLTPKFVDSIFCLFPLKHTHKTVFKNPLFKSFYLSCGGYGNIPSKPFGTTPEFPEFLEYCQNAMNMNGEQTGFNKEVTASLTNKDDYSQTTGLFSDDRTSFFIGLPTETDNTYQQGMTSLSPINFEINVTQEEKDNGDEYKAFAKEVQCPPLLCLLYDSNISILVQQNGMPPLVRMGNFDITSPE